MPFPAYDSPYKVGIITVLSLNCHLPSTINYLSISKKRNLEPGSIHHAESITASLFSLCCCLFLPLLMKESHKHLILRSRFYTSPITQ